MKFSIRDLFLVTVIVALVVGWFVDHLSQANRIKELESEQVRSGPGGFF